MAITHQLLRLNITPKSMTMKQIFYILFVSCGLIQFSLAKPAAFDSNEDYLKGHNLCHLRKNYTDNTPGEKDNELAPSMQLLKMTLYTLQDSTLTYARKANAICELLIKDPALNENPSEVMQEFKRRINKYLEVYVTCSGMEELLKLINFYARFTSDYYKMEEDKKLTENGKIILDILKKYDSQKLDAEHKSTFNEFATNFAKKFNEIEEDLKKEKSELGSKILQWWETTKNLKDNEEKFEAFDRFIILFNENK